MKYLFLLAFAGCGVTLHSDPVKVNPIQVIVTPNINLQAVMSYCANTCNTQSSDPVVRSTCTQDCYSTFNSILSQALLPQTTPTPSQ
jgi:hypothetical protein